MFEFCVILMIIQREKNSTIPEIYYLAQNKNSDLEIIRKHNKQEKCIYCMLWVVYLSTGFAYNLFVELYFNEVDADPIKREEDQFNYEFYRDALLLIILSTLVFSLMC